MYLSDFYLFIFLFVENEHSDNTVAIIIKYYRCHALTMHLSALWHAHCVPRKAEYHAFANFQNCHQSKSTSNFNLKCIWLHFEMNISKCLKNCVLLDPMHSPLNGGTCFAEESAIPETPRILFLKFHRNKENPSHSKVSEKFCKHLVIIYDLYERWHVWLSWHCHVESKSKSFCI